MNQILKRWADSAADRLGCKVIPEWRLPRFHQTEYLRRLLGEFRIDCVFDVGANLGQFRDYLRGQVGYDGMILSFEPHPECARELSRRSESEQSWHSFDYALGAQVGTLQFNLMRDSQFSSFHAPLHPEHLSLGSDNVIVQTLDVSVRALNDVYDDLARRFGFQRPFLKLDTQGHELEVLKGANLVLPHFSGMQTELPNIAIYENGVNLGTSIDALERMGFNLGTLFPTNPEQFPVAIDFDAYFLRRQGAASAQPN